ncbi:carbohydrate porin [Paracoccus denitrificans]|uniref:carbohydrate porin n=1 Tax=Paracoccus denitrificans TaxID=266 RepID=UPI000CECB1DF|nr:carbohydrate porin [Paracoccus denitrificans]
MTDTQSPNPQKPRHLGERALALMLSGLFATVLLGGTAPAVAQALPNCAKYDQLNHRGSEVPYPSNCEAIDPELGGLREKLFSRGWNLQVVTTQGLTYDLRGNDGGPQIYTGQKPTANASVSLVFTHDLSRYGLPDGSLLTFAPVAGYTSFSGAGLSHAYINQLSAMVPLNDGQVVLQAGQYNMASQFYGQAIGNNLAASALGPQSFILYGLGVGGLKPTPAFDIRLSSADKRFYTHFGVARSISPDGLFADGEENHSGLKFSTRGAKAVFINEVGYRVQPDVNQRNIWLRAGAVYNTSDFAHLDDPATTGKNYGGYVVATYQLSQPDMSAPYQGWYFTGSVNFARKQVNAFSHDAGLVFYRIGTFKSRPYDVFSIGAAKTYFSDVVVQNATDLGLEAASSSTSFLASYTYRLQQGAYLQSAITYIDNPTLAPVRPSALNASVNLTLVF